MKILLKFQLLSQSVASVEQKNVRVQFDAPATLKEAALLGMHKAGFDPGRIEISSAMKGSHPVIVCLDEEPVNLGVYSIMLRERSEVTLDRDALWKSSVSSKNLSLPELGCTGTDTGIRSLCGMALTGSSSYAKSSAYIIQSLPSSGLQHC